MRFYGCGLQEIMRMTVTSFWALVAQIPRLQAEQSLRTIQTVQAAVWGNEAYVDALMADDSEDDTINETLDESAFKKFKTAFG